MQAALIHLRSHINRTAALQAATDACRISREHFSRAFKASTGMTPSRWHLEHRLMLAQELMTGTCLSLVDIAHDCGFADQSHFTNVFRRHRKQSPGAWRRSRLIEKDAARNNSCCG